MTIYVYTPVWSATSVAGVNSCELSAVLGPKLTFSAFCMSCYVYILKLKILEFPKCWLELQSCTTVPSLYHWGRSAFCLIWTLLLNSMSPNYASLDLPPIVTILVNSYISFSTNWKLSLEYCIHKLSLLKNFLNFYWLRPGLTMQPLAGLELTL